MSDYIIHNIKLSVNSQLELDFDELVEKDKPVDRFPNYYLGKIIGGKGRAAALRRKEKLHLPERHDSKRLQQQSHLQAARRQVERQGQHTHPETLGRVAAPA